MAKPPWHGPAPRDDQDWLAWLLVSHTSTASPGSTHGNGWNPYTDARRLGAGSGGDDHWHDIVQTSSIPAVWEYHDTTGGGSVPKTVVIERSVLIPYVVKDKLYKDSLDHFLVGYMPEGATAAGTLPSWGAASATHPLEKLGYLIAQDLNPAGANARVIASWHANAIQDPTGYVRPRRWAFRRVEYNVEKSVLVPSARDLTGGNHCRADILVGFVGGGAI